MKSIKIISLLLFASYVYCDGADWIKDEISPDPLPTDQAELSSTSTPGPVNEIPSIQENPKPIVLNDSSSTLNQTLSSSTASESTTTSTPKPPPKQVGCTELLWGEGSKFCWTRCNTASTSGFFNTWCFTTDSLVESNTTKKVECDSDDKCRPEWRCKSSCGMFSPHWDRQKSIDNIETIQSFYPLNYTKLWDSYSTPKPASLPLV